MPRKRTISYEDFYAKANAIQELFGKVTYERMREHLGSGSMSTIQQFMGRWKEEQQKNTERGIPKSLSDRIDVVVRDVYAQISTIAEEEKQTIVAENVKSLEHERYRADRADAHAIECSKKLKKRTKEIKILTERLHEQDAVISALTAKLESSERELEAKHNELHDISQALEIQSEKQNEQVTRLENQYLVISRTLSKLTGTD